MPAVTSQFLRQQGHHEGHSFGLKNYPVDILLIGKMLSFKLKFQAKPLFVLKREAVWIFLIHKEKENCTALIVKFITSTSPR